MSTPKTKVHYRSWDFAPTQPRKPNVPPSRLKNYENKPTEHILPKENQVNRTTESPAPSITSTPPLIRSAKRPSSAPLTRAKKTLPAFSIQQSKWKEIEDQLNQTSLSQISAIKAAKASITPTGFADFVPWVEGLLEKDPFGLERVDEMESRVAAACSVLDYLGRHDCVLVSDSEGALSDTKSESSEVQMEGIGHLVTPILQKLKEILVPALYMTSSVHTKGRLEAIFRSSDPPISWDKVLHTTLASPTTRPHQNVNSTPKLQLVQAADVYKELKLAASLHKQKETSRALLKDAESRDLRVKLAQYRVRITDGLSHAICRWEHMVKLSVFRLWANFVKLSNDKVGYCVEAAERLAKRSKMRRVFYAFRTNALLNKREAATTERTSVVDEHQSAVDRIQKLEMLTSKLQYALREQQTMADDALDERNQMEQRIENWLRNPLAIDFEQPIRDEEGVIIKSGVLYFNADPPEDNQDVIQSGFYRIKLKRQEERKAKITPSELMRMWINSVMEEAVSIARRSQIAAQQAQKKAERENKPAPGIEGENEPPIQLPSSLPNNEEHHEIQSDVITQPQNVANFLNRFRNTSAERVRTWSMGIGPGMIVPVRLISMVRDARARLRKQQNYSLKVPKRNSWFITCDDSSESGLLVANLGPSLCNGDHLIALLSSLFPNASNTVLKDFLDADQWEKATETDKISKVMEILKLLGVSKGFYESDIANHNTKAMLVLLTKLFLYHNVTVLYMDELNTLAAAEAQETASNSSFQHASEGSVPSPTLAQSFAKSQSMSMMGNGSAILGGLSSRFSTIVFEEFEFDAQPDEPLEIWQFNKLVTDVRPATTGNQVLVWVSDELYNKKKQKKQLKKAPSNPASPTTGSLSANASVHELGRHDSVTTDNEPNTVVSAFHIKKRDLQQLWDWSSYESHGLQKIVQLCKIISRYRLPEPIRHPAMFDALDVQAAYCIQISDLLGCHTSITVDQLLLCQPDYNMVFIVGLYNKLHHITPTNTASPPWTPTRAAEEVGEDWPGTKPVDNHFVNARLGFIVLGENSKERQKKQKTSGGGEPIQTDKEGSKEKEAPTLTDEQVRFQQLVTLQITSTPVDCDIEALCSVSPFTVNSIMIQAPSSPLLQAEVLAINKLLYHYRSKIRDVFQYYASQGLGTVWVSKPEIFQMCSDLHIMHEDKLTKQEIDTIFNDVVKRRDDLLNAAAGNMEEYQQSLLGTLNSSAASALAKKRDAGSKKRKGGGRTVAMTDGLNEALSPTHFIDLLVLFAFELYGDDAQAGNSDCLALPLKKFLNEDICKRAEYAEFCEFRSIVYASPIQSVFKRYSKSLEKIFILYSMGSSRILEDRKLYYTSYIKLMLDTHVMNIYLDKKDVRDALPPFVLAVTGPLVNETQSSIDGFLGLCALTTIYANVQQNKPGLFQLHAVEATTQHPTNPKKTTAELLSDITPINYGSLLELLVAIAAFKFPHPWLPLHCKLQKFLNSWLVQVREILAQMQSKDARIKRIAQLVSYAGE